MTEPTQELRKAIREFREFCFAYRDKMHASGEVQSTRPLVDAQDALEGIIQAQVAAEVTKALDEAEAMRVCLKCNRKGPLAKKSLTPLAALRVSNSLTQTEVAKRLRMNRTNYAMVELGKSNLLAHRVLPLAQILGVSADVVLEALAAQRAKYKPNEDK